MAILSKGARQQLEEHWAKSERESAALREPPPVEHLSIEEQISKLEADLAAFAPVEPPAENSKSQPPSEVVRRLERLEAQQPLSGAPPPPLPVHQAEYINRRVELLQRLRRQKTAQEQAERQREHERRAGEQIKRLEGRIADVQKRLEEEQQRHRRAMAELNAALSEAKDKLVELTRPLSPDETSEQRLQEVQV